MQVKVTKDGGRALIHLSGRFDFNTHHEFRGAVEPLAAASDISAVTIDFSNVDYLDSSALGMLLMLRDKAKAAEREIRLSNCSVPVRQVLDVANFQKLFRID